MSDYERFDDYQPYGEERNTLALGLTFLFIGLGIGALTALLLAPKSGRKMRKDLRRRYEDARDWFDEVSEQAGDLWERGSGVASDVRDKVRPIAQAARRRMS